MNLLDDPWIPVRRAGGKRERIAPHQLTSRLKEDPIIALDAPRADFNGALMQFLIGLVHTAWAHAAGAWDLDPMRVEPPTPDGLRDAFAPLREAFDFNGDGARFMQDRTLGEADKPANVDIAGLLIDAPGAQAVRYNTDHFVKAGRVKALCPSCAATALFTLMVNAPSGGAGHRTSLRGGGPLTTLVVYEPETPDDPPRMLWRDLACNIPAIRLEKSGAGPQAELTGRIFPWLQPQTELQAPGNKAETQPDAVSPLHAYWAMPRRIRLGFDAIESGTCDLCANQDVRLVTHYMTKNYGLNYKGPWLHPLSPYRAGKPGEPPIPIHPQPDGLGYRHWLGWVLGTSQAKQDVMPAMVVRDFLARDLPGPFRLWAFGFDMDNMKPRGWYEATMPLFKLPVDYDDSFDALRAVVSQLLDGALLCAQALRSSVRDAWFGAGEARGDLGFIDAGFWAATEHAFYERVADAVQQVRAGVEPTDEQTHPLRQAWLDELARTTRQLFDQHAASGSLGGGQPRRLAAAHKALMRRLDAPLRTAVGLPLRKESAKRKTAPSRTTTEKQEA